MQQLITSSHEAVGGAQIGRRVRESGGSASVIGGSGEFGSRGWPELRGIKFVGGSREASHAVDAVRAPHAACVYSATHTGNVFRQCNGNIGSRRRGMFGGWSGCRMRNRFGIIN